jgi:hypothetical protein
MVVSSVDVWVMGALTAAVLGSALAAAGGYALPRWLAVFVGAAAVALALRRDTWLPFLGETVLPPSLFREPFGPRLDTVDVPIRGVSPGASLVVYWASESEDATDPIGAYGSFANAGIAKTSDGGIATLRLRCPGRYSVPGGSRPHRHAHYREVFDDGVLGPVKTATVNCIP